MIVYRLSRQKYKSELSGLGAALLGGRWNKKGIEVIYTASSRALAMAEVLVHFTLQELPDDYFMLTIYLPDTFTFSILMENELPAGWNIFPYILGVQSMTNELFQMKKYGYIQVPSAVVKGDYNYLIDPSFKDFNQVKIIDEERFPFDRRLVFS